MQPRFDAFFAALHPGEASRRFCLWHAPAQQAPNALFVHVHAFAEEMNKSRRMAALQSRALAAAGNAVLQMDLLGCGDSDGDFGDATWEAWVADVVAACQLAQARVAQEWPDAPSPALWLWGHRAGCLLASQAVAHLQGPWQLLFWQATPKGKTVLQQFLRLEAAGALMGRASDKPTAKAMLAAGQVAEVAGYRLRPELAQGLEGATLMPVLSVRQLVWIDVSPQADSTPSPAVQSAIDTWSAAGCGVRHQSVVGPSFWQTTEIEDAPGLVEATLRAVDVARNNAAPTVAPGVPLAPPRDHPVRS